MKALILAGGLGTRLRGVVTDLPKPMAPVAGRPFLEYLLLQLARHGLTEVVLSTGHLAEKVSEHFGSGEQLGLHLSYSRERSPRGTGGAIKLATPLIGGQAVLVMNGDSVVDADLTEVAEGHRERNALATMVLTRVEDTSRYGAVEIGDGGEIERFVEKREGAGAGLINSGVYLLSPQVLQEIPDAERPVSLEREVFPSLVGRGFYGHSVDGFFKDIGVPEDYRALCDDPEPLLRTTGAG